MKTTKQLSKHQWISLLVVTSIVSFLIFIGARYGMPTPGGNRVPITLSDRDWSCSEYNVTSNGNECVNYRRVSK